MVDIKDLHTLTLTSEGQQTFSFVAGAFLVAWLGAVAILEGKGLE